MLQDESFIEYYIIPIKEIYDLVDIFIEPMYFIFTFFEAF